MEMMSPDPIAEYAKLEEFLSGQNPLALLSQLTLTFMFAPVGEFQGKLATWLCGNAGLNFFPDIFWRDLFPIASWR